MKRFRGAAILLSILPVVLFLPSGASASDDDRILLRRAPDGGGAQGIYTMRTDGSDLTFLAAGFDPAWSPDAKRIAFAKQTAIGMQLFVMDADGTDEVQLTNTSGYNRFPSWSPDGSRIAFTSSRDGQDEIYTMNADGSNVIRLTNYTGVDSDASWSPDGTKIVFASARPSFLVHVHVMNADGTGLVQLTTTGASNRDPVFSPDGSKIAFASFRFGSANAYELMVMNADGSAQTRLTTNTGNDDQPEWSPDGTKIAFASRQPPEVITNKQSVVIIDADGTDPVRLTSAGFDASISWRTLASCVTTGDGDADESGPVSSPVHDIVEPMAGPAAETLHGINCTEVAARGL